jgi:hypothetical protein
LTVLPRNATTQAEAVNIGLGFSTLDQTLRQIEHQGTAKNNAFNPA